MTATHVNLYGTKVKVAIRWMIRKDMPRILDIDTLAGTEPFWTEQDFLTCLRQRNCIGMVATVMGIEALIVASMVYELHKSTLSVLRLAVDPDWQRKGIASACIDKIKERMSEQRRRRINCVVPEACLPMQLLLRANGFRCDRVVRNEFEECDGLAFRFDL